MSDRLKHPLSYPLPLLIAPTRLEYSTIRKSLIDFHGNAQFRLAICGVGEKRAEKFGAQLKPELIQALVLVGWAGGLSADLPTGQVIFAESALRDGKPAIPCRTLPIQNAVCCPVLTVPTALSTAAEKRSARSTGALAVEMEAYPLAAWASGHGIPFIHARVILDSLEDDLPGLSTRNLRFITDSLRLIKLIRKVDPILGQLARDIAVNIVETSPRML